MIKARAVWGRVALGSATQRPRWGDTATVRIGADEASLAPQRVVLGGAPGRGRRGSLTGMKAGVCGRASGEFGAGRCCVAFDEMKGGVRARY